MAQISSGGLAIVQLDQEGRAVRWNAATLHTKCRHVAVNTEMLAMAVAATNAPEEGGITLWCDCQVVVSGFADLEDVADHHKVFYAGMWRVVRSAIEENGCRTTVKKIKAPRQEADIAEEDRMGWLGNEAADEWAKIGARGRN